MKLSIIIPYYNAKKYTDELLACLEPQMNNEVEVILVDDGSKEPFKTNYKWVTVYRKPNGGCATARNYGLERSKGEYIQFIDADDLVPDYFIRKLFAKINETKADMIDYSWKSLTAEGPQHNHLLKTEKDKLSNPSVCTRCFKRTFIGDTRFNELKDSTEDEDFSRKVGYLDPECKYKHAAITDYMYFYRTAITDSKVKRFKRGLMKTRRIVYHYNHVTKDMTWLLDEIKEEDKHNEVWLITSFNEIPELKKYCQIGALTNIWGHELRGEPYKGFTKIEPAIRTQVVMYLEFANMVGGIASFIYYWCQEMKSINTVVLYDKLDDKQVERISKVVPIYKNDGTHEFICDTLILNRLTDKIPDKVTYNKIIQMCHACKQFSMKIPQRGDYLVNVSQAAKDSWGESSERGIVIHNMFHDESDELLLVSATRMQTGDKGNNDGRVRKLAEMLNEAGIKFTWLNFSDKALNNPPENFINMGPRINIQNFIKRADYLVQLSDKEAYSMSILEALSLQTAVLVTPMDVVPEFGIEDNMNGYIIPFDMNFDVRKILNVPKFFYINDNKKAKKEWQKLLAMPGTGISNKTDEPLTTSKVSPVNEDKEIKNESIQVRVLKKFKDKYTGEIVHEGKIISLSKSRVNDLLEAEKEKKCKLIEVL